jgi:hypothetical protein
MTTIDDLRQELENKYLEPATEQTPSTPLAAAMDSSELTFTITEDILSPDELSLIGPGSLLELEYELVRVQAFNGSTWVVTAQRGVRGTTAAAHAIGTDVRFPTRWPRQVIADSITAAIEALWQPLFAVEEQRATVDPAGYLALPTDTVRILQVQYENEFGRWDDADGVLFSTHPMDETISAIQVEPVARASALCVVRYGRQIMAPDTVTDDIVGLPKKWERIIIADAGAELLSGVDIDAVTQEVLTQQLRLERFGVRSGSTISQALLGYREYLVAQAESELGGMYPRGIEMMPVNYVG